MAALIGLGAASVNAQLPPDFPSFTVTTNDTNAVANGYIFLEVTSASTNTGHYVMILQNDGTLVSHLNVTNAAYDFQLLADGRLHFASSDHSHGWTDGGDGTHKILDSDFNPVETIGAGNRYLADTHDFELLPNGHALLTGYYQTPMDLSPYVPGGNPNALVGGAVIQELDAARNVVFQWRTWDHFTVPSYFPAAAFTNGTLAGPVVNAFNLSTVLLDTDGNLLVSNFGMDVWKINRQTGNILWRLGGPANQFSFAGVNPTEAVGHFSGQTLSRLDNGHLLIYCNADSAATHTSKVFEYQLDETNKIATLIWSYTPPTNYYSWHYGSAQRLTNGNTLIGWGAANIVPGIGGATNQHIPACTEVAPDGHVVFQLAFDDSTIISYRAYRFVYPPESQTISVTVNPSGGGNSYDLDPAGVSITVVDVDGFYPSVTLTRDPYASVNPQFEGQAPRVLPMRVGFTGSGITYLDTEIDFDVASFGLADPGNLTVYYRPEVGQGVFTPLPTAYNPITKKLVVALRMLCLDFVNLGEFIFGQPEVTESPSAPILAAAENDRGIQSAGVIAPLPAAPGTNYSVNQLLPVSLAWSPAGVAAGYHLQIATNAVFSNPTIDVPFQTAAFYVWSNALPSTTYYYRVNTTNDAGISAWSAGAFQTVMVQEIPGIPKITRIQKSANGGWILEWSDTSADVYIEFSPTLVSTQWQTVGGPIVGLSSWTNSPSTASTGFYRLRLQ